MPMSSINRVVLVGNLTRDPELRSLASTGHSVCHLRIACNGRRKTKEGSWVDRAHFFDVSVFGPQAETTHRYLRKGKPVAVDGRLEWREWEIEGQAKRQAVSIVADTVQFLGTPDPRPAGDSAATTDAQPAHQEASEGGARADGSELETVAVAAGSLDQTSISDDVDEAEDLTF